MEFELKLFWLLITAILGGTFVLVGKIIWDWLSVKRNGKPVCASNHECVNMLRKLSNNTHWLREVHEKSDENGVPLWYVPRELISILRTLNESRIESTLELKGIKAVLEDNQKLLEKMVTCGKG